MDDLISRAAAIEAIVSLTAFENEDELKKFVEKKACDDYYLGGLCDVIDEIKELPAVDAVPVVHVRWIEKRWITECDWCVINHRALVCTACSIEIADGEKTPYCPNCGAKMDV